MSEKHSSASKSKLLGTVLLILALFGFFVFIYRLCYYHYEYDPQYSPVDYGKYNILSYFTVHQISLRMCISCARHFRYSELKRRRE